MKILLAESAGFCFGVRNAVELLEKAVKKAEKGESGPVFTWGPIIHNREVTDAYEKRGVRILSELSDLSEVEDTPGKTVLIRAHGVAPEIYEELRRKGFSIIDGTCPFVARIHDTVRKESENGRKILIFGNPNHPEVKGILGWCKEEVVVVSTKEEAKALSIPEKCPVCTVFQTTFDHTKFKEFVEIVAEKGYDNSVFNTICSATRKRQEEAADIARRADVMIVIGDRKSSNTQRLVEICKAQCRYTYHVQTASELDPTWFADIHTLGITAGASTPTNIIEEVFVTCQKTT